MFSTSYFESEGRWFQARLFSVFSCCFLRQLKNCIPHCFSPSTRNYATAKVRPYGVLRLQVRLQLNLWEDESGVQSNE